MRVSRLDRSSVDRACHREVTYGIVSIFRGPIYSDVCYARRCGKDRRRNTKADRTRTVAADKSEAVDRKVSHVP